MGQQNIDSELTDRFQKIQTQVQWAHEGMIHNCNIKTDYIKAEGMKCLQPQISAHTQVLLTVTIESTPEGKKRAWKPIIACIKTNGLEVTDVSVFIDWVKVKSCIDKM